MERVEDFFVIKDGSTDDLGLTLSKVEFALWTSTLGRFIDFIGGFWSTDVNIYSYRGEHSINFSH